MYSLGTGFFHSVFPWRFIEVAVWINSIFIFMVKQLSMVWIYRSLLNHAPLEGHLGWFHFELEEIKLPKKSGHRLVWSHARLIKIPAKAWADGAVVPVLELKSCLWQWGGGDSLVCVHVSALPVVLRATSFHDFFPFGRTPLSQFLQEGLRVTNPFVSSFYENVFIPFSFLSDSVSRYWLCNGPLKDKVWPASGLHHSREEICSHSHCCFLQLMHHFWWQPSRVFCFVLFFGVFFWSLVFKNLMRMCLLTFVSVCVCGGTSCLRFAQLSEH